MKRIHLLLLTGFVLFALFLGACSPAPEKSGSEGEESGLPEAEIPEENVSVMNTVFDDSPFTATLLHESATGLWYMLSNGISESVNSLYPGSIIHATPGAPAPNIIRLNAGESDFGFFHSVNGYEAYQGLSRYEEKHENLAGIASFHPSPFQFVLRADLGVTTFEEIIDQQLKLRLSIGNIEGSAHDAFLRVIGEYGLTVEDMESWGCFFTNKSMADTAQMFSDNSIDGYVIVASAPAPMVVENAVSRDLVMIEIDQQIVEVIADQYQYAVYTLSEDVYDFLNGDTATFASYTLLGASAEVPDEMAYKIARSIHENLEYIRLIHAVLKNISPETLVQNVNIPLHPGAERYYREIGLID